MRALALLAMVAFTALAETSPVWHVRLVDKGVNGNLLFRGGSPEVPYNNNTADFSYDGLVSSLRQAHPLPANFSLVVVDLEALAYAPSEGNWDALHGISEHRYFAAHPDKGSFLLWPMVGAPTDPLDPVFDGHRGWIASTMEQWDSDRLESRLALLRKMLTTTAARPTAIYFHCDCGCDRTGELAGAYMMRYQGFSYDAVVAYNDAIEPQQPGRMQCPNLWNLAWYCFRLGGSCMTRHACDPGSKRRRRR